MSIGEKARTAVWFAGRPSHWAHAKALAVRKIRSDRDGEILRSAAGDWAASNTTSLDRVLRAVGYENEILDVSTLIGKERYSRAEERIGKCPVTMGGPGDLRLLFYCCEAANATRVVETGVAYGWSSLAILSSLSRRSGARLTSVDMPYPKRGNERWVGVAVPPELSAHWHLIRLPDQNGLRQALQRQDGPIDVCHYDSDKSYYGRMWAYPQLWDALRPGGVFISDDVQNNFAFKEFVEERGAPFFIVESQGKYVGIILKA